MISNIRPYLRRLSTVKTRADVQQMFFASRQFNLNMQRIYSALYILTNSLHLMVAGYKRNKNAPWRQATYLTYPIVLPTENELEEFNAIAFPVIDAA